MDDGRTKPGLIPLWVGEGDMATPAFIADAATRSLAAGETFYTWQRGIPELRAAISAYMSRAYGRPLPLEKFFVTGSGTQAVQIATRIVAGLGDEASPLVGLRPTALTLSGDPVAQRLEGVEPHVWTEGGGYFFLPSRRALRFLAA